MENKTGFLKREIALVMMIAFVLSTGTWIYVKQVSSQLWSQSISTMTESIRQGVNALNMQLEMDFDELVATGKNISQADESELADIIRLYHEVRMDINIYLEGERLLDQNRKPDQVVVEMLEQTDKELGILDAHNSSVTGENVFNIFCRFALSNGTAACLVKEYRAKEIAAQFTPSFYGHSGFSYLVNRDGAIMVRSRHRNSNKTIQNLFDLIPKEENDEQVIQQLRESILGLKSGWARFYDQGVGLVFCYEPIWSDSGWMLVSIVAEENILAQTNSILVKTLCLAIVQIGLILVLFFIFYTGKMRENTRHTYELEQALQVADRANNVKGAFLMNMSHDIRTPLNAIIGMTAIAQKRIDSRERTKDCLKKINMSGRYLLNLVNDVMDMSQLDNGKMILNEETVQIDEIFSDVVSLMDHRVQEAGLTMEALPPKLNQQTVLADPMRMRQIMVNIIDNAIKYTPSGGRILLRLEQTRDVKEGCAVYHFSCSDTGIGMDSDFLEKVFQPFERSRNTTASGIAGTGVGLAITKGLLELMGGSILAESEPGEGSVFTAVFPLQAVEEDAEQAVSGEQPEVSQQSADGVQPETNVQQSVTVQTAIQRQIANDEQLGMTAQGTSVVPPVMDASQSSTKRPIEGQLGVDGVRLAEECKCQDSLAAEVVQPEGEQDWQTQQANDGEQSEPANENAVQEDAQGGDYTSKRVLLVEDVELNMEIAEAMIGMTGVQIEKAYDGLEAVQLVEEKPSGYFDLIFMDIQMPVMDGYEATRRIRAMQREDAAHIPIFALSANALAEDVENSRKAGMNGHIAKPIDMEPIEKVMRQYFC
ncbi:MAG: response regulator [Eubacterium sp.]|nr:response regulator [Eubacterium sp.]